jgi:hypothetical protein
MSESKEIWTLSGLRDRRLNGNFEIGVVPMPMPMAPPVTRANIVKGIAISIVYAAIIVGICLC